MNKTNFISELVNNSAIVKTFVNLYCRWQDEKKYEDFNDYIAAMKKAVEKHYGTIEVTKGMKRPFGIEFTIEGEKVHLELRIKRGGCCLAACFMK